MKHGENAGTYSVSWKAGDRWVDHLGRVWPLPSPTQRLQFRVRAHAALRAFVYHRDGYRCQRCGVVAEVPVSQGDMALPGRPLPDGSPGPSLACAVIVKRVDARTRAKTSINDLLRA